MNIEEKPALLYHKMRGNGQIIRSLLHQIGVDYNEVFVTQNGIQKDLQDQCDLQIANVPYLIFEGQVICGVFSIARFCCKRFGRQELLGVTLEQQTLVAEVGMKYMNQKNKCIKKIFQCLNNLRSQPNYSQFLGQVFNYLFKYMENMKYFQAFKRLYLQSGGYLLGKMTILDFIFFETCTFIQNFFGFQNQKIVYMYLQFFKSTQFYQKNSQYLQKFPFFIKSFDPIFFQMVKRMWKGNPRLLEE